MAKRYVIPFGGHPEDSERPPPPPIVTVEVRNVSSQPVIIQGVRIQPGKIGRVRAGHDTDTAVKIGVLEVIEQ